MKLLELEVEIVEQARAALARQRGIDVSRASFQDVAAFAVATFLPEIAQKMEEVCAREGGAEQPTPPEARRRDLGQPGRAVGPSRDLTDRALAGLPAAAGAVL